jgi:hypothetical protein
MRHKAQKLVKAQSVSPFRARLLSSFDSSNAAAGSNAQDIRSLHRLTQGVRNEWKTGETPQGRP